MKSKLSLSKADQMLDLPRYTRQMSLPEIGLSGQLLLSKAKILVVGAGGIGSTVLMHLAAMGIGLIGIIDNDVVDRSNLHRQIIHRDDNVGQSKVKSAVNFIKGLNPEVKVKAFDMRLTHVNSEQVFKEFDVVIDGSDNAQTRYLINDTCVLYDIPLISGAAVKWEGQITVYNYQDGPCYRCLYPECPKASNMMSCSANGVFGPVPSLVGIVLAAEAVKVILGLDGVLVKRLLLINMRTMAFKAVRIRGRKQGCFCKSIRNEQGQKVFSKIDYDELIGATCAITKQKHVLDNHWLVDWEQVPELQNSQKNHDQAVATSFVDKDCSQKKDIPAKDKSTTNIKNSIDCTQDNTNADLLKIDQSKAQLPVLLDVRPDSHYKIVHIQQIEGLHNDRLPITDLREMQTEEIVSKFNGKQVFVFCRAGVISKEATFKLRHNGVTAFNVNGGILELMRKQGFDKKLIDGI